MLGPLQNNGGPTPTMALLPGSPAIDAGNPSGCTDGLGHLLKTDQRGMPRPDKEDIGGCDMGAYERQNLSVPPAKTTTMLVSSMNPSVFNHAVEFKSPSGTVTFKDVTTATTLDTVTLSAGEATFTTSTLAVGLDSIIAEYNGSPEYNTSTSSPLLQAVNKEATSVKLLSSLNPSVVGQSVTFSATVTAVAPGSGTPTGMVTFKNGATALGTDTLSGGKATLSTSALAVGPHSITATYGGSVDYNSSTSAVLTQTVNKAAVSTFDPKTGVVAPVARPKNAALRGQAAVSALNAALSPTSLTFPTQAIGTASAAKTVTLKNTGTMSLSITAIAIAGTNAGDFAQTHSCGSSLAAGASCSIGVTFKPTVSTRKTS
jgi:hypothetical protein